MNRSLLLIVAVLVGAMGRAGMSAPIVYSWTGTLERRNEANDPWGLGDVMTPFFISVAVKEEARDRRGDDGDEFDLTFAFFSGFDLTDPQFRIDGEPAIVREDNRILFFDSESTDFVEILMGDVFFRGRSVAILSKARIPGSTFTFDENFESPPTFSPVTTKFPSSAPLGESPYRAAVDAGVTVTGALIPEPSTLSLALMALLGVTMKLRRNRNRVVSDMCISCVVDQRERPQ